MRRTAAIAGTGAFLLLAPGTVAGLAPYLLTGWHAGRALPGSMPLLIAGAVMIAAGAGVLLDAFARFALAGGTPAPVAPTAELVVSGLYRHVRNPMYLAVIAVVAGQYLILRRPVLLGYAAALWLAFAIFVRWYEQPALRRRYGLHYETYLRNVRGWLPRLRPWAPDWR